MAYETLPARLIMPLQTLRSTANDSRICCFEISLLVLGNQVNNERNLQRQMLIRDAGAGYERPFIFGEQTNAYNRQMLITDKCL